MQNAVSWNSPQVSVIMPAYNAEAYILAAIRSVQAQTVKQWELLVVDDGSEDETCQMVSRLAERDPRIHLYANPNNRGTAHARNYGLALCRGDYVAFLDSDDRWHSEKLEKQLALAKATNADLVYCSYAIVDETDRAVCRDFIVPPYTDLGSMLKKNVIGCSTVLLTRTAAGRFCFSDRYYHEDYAFWLQLLGAGYQAAGVEEVLVDYRFRTGSRAANKITSAKHRWRIYRSFMKLSLPRSAYYMGHYLWNGVAKYHRANNSLNEETQ